MRFGDFAIETGIGDSDSSFYTKDESVSNLRF